MPQIAENLNNSLMVAAALDLHIGCGESAANALEAYWDGTSPRAGTLALGSVNDAEHDRWVVPADMTHLFQSDDGERDAGLRPR